MKQSIYLIGITLISMTSCKNLDIQQGSQAEIAEIDPFPTESELNEIVGLLRAVYTWESSDQPAEIGMVTDENDRYIGFNLSDLEINIGHVKGSRFFTEAFVDNYTDIHKEVHRKLENGEYEWHVGELPPYGNGVNPWCNCQDVPFNYPNSWDDIELISIHSTETTGELYWKWGNLGENPGSGWAAFKYHFTVKKVNGSWKIDSMEGIDSMFD